MKKLITIYMANHTNIWEINGNSAALLFPESNINLSKVTFQQTHKN